MTPPTVEAIKKTEDTYKHQCKFCDRKFKTKRGLHIHMAACDNQHGLIDKAFPVEGINAVFDTPENRWFRVSWEGFASNEDSWEPERSLVRQGCQRVIKKFWTESGINPSIDFVPDPDNVWRCWDCGRGYKTASALKAHITRTHSKRQWRGTTADKDTRRKMRKEAQEELTHVICEGKEIENVWTFKYLGSRFQADGDQIADIKARIASAATTAGKMRHIWSSMSVPLRLKLRIYKTGVCSRLVYGSEGWILDTKACAMLNGANARMISHITNKTVREESSRRTRTFDVVRWIRARRLQWVGHILRMRDTRLVHKAAKYIYDNKKEGDLLMDVPAKYSWRELKMMAGAQGVGLTRQQQISGRNSWRKRVRHLRNPPQVVVMMNDNAEGTDTQAREKRKPPLSQIGK